MQLHVGREALAYCQCLYRENKALFASVDLIGEKNQVILEYWVQNCPRLQSWNTKPFWFGVSWNLSVCNFWGVLNTHTTVLIISKGTDSVYSHNMTKLKMHPLYHADKEVTKINILYCTSKSIDLFTLLYKFIQLHNYLLNLNKMSNIKTNLFITQQRLLG